ncbi:MAG: extracellular solute-binding protein [Gammaproteobacteria bacterium]|nr:extracellular solute-binding protein [Gammaproteobacteria bacterium]
MPAFAQDRELRLLAWSHFVPASDEELDRQLAEFGKQAGVKVRADHIAHLQLPAVLAGEVSGQKGHDIVNVTNSNPDLYADHLEDITDLYDAIGKAGGGWTTDTMGKTTKGTQTALPWYYISFPLAYRTDLIEEIGEKVPETWEDVHRVGMKLKKMGHPLGIQLGHSNDSNTINRGIMWSFGAKLVEADSKTVAINSKEAVEAFKFVRALYKDAMEEEVLAWDDRNNNVCLVSGKCSMILNPISAYRSAVTSKSVIPGTDKLVADHLMHVLPPVGPAGRHMAASFHGIGVWKFAQEKELAKEFLKFHFQKENQEKLLVASTGYNQPVLADFTGHEIYTSADVYKFATEIGKYTHSYGWPGVPTAAVQTVFDQFLLPDTLAECATDRLSPEEAVAKLESQMKRVYRRFERRA